MKISQTPCGRAARIGWTRPSQPLKSPTTLTRSARSAPTRRSARPAVAPTLDQVRAQLLVRAMLRPLAEQVQVEVGEDAAVAVRIVDLARVSAVRTSMRRR